MKRCLVKILMAVVLSLVVVETYAWGNKASKEAKAAAKAEKKVAKAEQSKHAIKQWQGTRFRNADVSSAVTKNGKLTAEDVAVTCNLPEAQPLVDGLLAGYVTLVNILDGYCAMESGNAAVGIVSAKMAAGKSRAEAEAELTDEETSAYTAYLDWLKKGENAGKVAIADEDLAKIMEFSTSVKEQWGAIKEQVKGNKDAKTAIAKDFVTVTKIVGSCSKGGTLLKNILLREKQAKKLIVEQ